MKKQRALKSKINSEAAIAGEVAAPSPPEVAAVENPQLEAQTLPALPKPWFLYLIECEGGSYYAGITTDVAKRYQTHQTGKGAKYTRARKPVRLLGAKQYANRSDAAKAEWAIRQLKKHEKLGFLLDC